MKIINNFNNYSLIAIIVCLLILPVLYRLPHSPYNSYFDAFDKLSLPLWASLYSLFWLRFNNEIKKTDRRLQLERTRNDNIGKTNNISYGEDFKSGLKEISRLEDELTQLKLHFDFINNTLRVSVIIVGIVKVIQAASPYILLALHYLTQNSPFQKS